ncbi:hypothetical protein AKJ08_1235 [Vulgatibacter incomptus]|uniref:TonB C-terminal domain-containing protein n=1 Tax=Vulgatibacter incomptus TaxID=1391653 RepID=A0A0K1PBD2_9BACT|nr:hypothetical protein AKJ08_1235 [Vulgatibacter incomptus]
MTRARDLPFNRENVLKVVSTHADEIQGCYESAMARRGATAKDAPSGRVLMSWVITPDGLAAEVKVAKSAIGDSLVTDCMVQAIRFWEFPKPATRQPIEFPFDLKPTNGAKTPKKKEAR